MKRTNSSRTTIMASRICRLAVIASILVYTGCANTRTFSQKDYVPGPDQSVKTLGLVRPMNPLGVFVSDSCASQSAQARLNSSTASVAENLLLFPFDILAVKGEADNTKRWSSEFASAAPTEPVDYSQLMTDALTQGLNSAGYTVNAVSVEKKAPAELVTKRSMFIGQADACLDTAVHFVGINKDCGSKKWYPIITLTLRLVSSRDAEILYNRSVALIPRKQASSGDIDPTYEFDDPKAVVADKKRALEGLRICIAQLADVISSDLNPTYPVIYIFSQPSLLTAGGFDSVTVNGQQIIHPMGSCQPVRVTPGRIEITHGMDMKFMGIEAKKSKMAIEAETGKAYYLKMYAGGTPLMVSEKEGAPAVAKLQSKKQFLDETIEEQNQKQTEAARRLRGY